MKKFRDQWEEDITSYIVDIYEHTFDEKIICSGCKLYKLLDKGLLTKEDFPYLKVDNKKIHFMNRPKLCKHLCIYYY